MIKLFATDMDHTLLDDDSNLPVNFESRVKSIHEKDKHFALVSGRSYSNIRNKIGSFSDDIIIVSDNGAVVTDKGEMLYMDTLSKETLKQLLDVVMKLENTSIIAIAKDGAYVNICENVDHYSILSEFYDEYNHFEDISDIKDDIIKVTTLNTENMKEIYDRIHPLFPDNVRGVMSGSIWIDIMNDDIHKAKGIQMILDRYGLESKNFVAFGDYLNDLTMIELAGIGYAVKNAHPKILEVADTIIGTNNEDSVFSTIESYFE